MGVLDINANRAGYPGQGSRSDMVEGTYDTGCGLTLLTKETGKLWDPIGRTTMVSISDAQGVRFSGFGVVM